MSPNEHSPNCRNCGAALAGEYCGRCGQREGRGDRGFAALLGELAGELFDWDSRFWRTLWPLLVRPGFLTAEYIAGRRARYVAPLRLYLIISFFMFLFLSLGAGNTIRVATPQPGAEVAGAAGQVARESVPAAGDGELSLQLADEGSPRWLQDLDARLEVNAARMAADPDIFYELLRGYLPQMMFVLLPLFALLLRCCYLLSPFDYLQHLVFTLHFYSFAYLVYLLGKLLAYWLYPQGGGGWQLLILALYLMLGLRRCYGSGLAAAAGKTLLLLITNAIALALGFAAATLLVLALG